MENDYSELDDRRGRLAHDIADQHNSGMKNRIRQVLDSARRNPSLAAAIGVAVAAVIFRAVRRR